jgi:DNA polymerase-3 subunit beta
MQLQVPAKALAEALSLADRIVPSRSSNPSLTQIRLEAVGSPAEALRLSGTNLELDLRASVAAEVKTAGSCVVPAQILNQVVSRVAADQVTLSASAKELTLTAGKAATRLAVGDESAFPPLDFAETAELTVDAGELRRSLTSVKYAAAVEEFRAVFRGIQFELHGDSARVVASDGFRLAYRDFALQSAAQRKVIVPARSVEEFLRVLRDGAAGLTLEAGSLTLHAGAVVMRARLMEGDFPDYARVIPKEMVAGMIVDARTLENSVARVAVLAERNSSRVDLVLANGVLRLAAEGDYGRSTDELEVEVLGKQKEYTVAFNARYLSEAVRVMEGAVQVEFSGQSGQAAPAVFKPAEDPRLLAVIVPLRMS